MRRRLASCLSIVTAVFFTMSAGSALAAEPTKMPPLSKTENQTNKSEQKKAIEGATSKPSNKPKQPVTDSNVGNGLQISAVVPTDFDKTILINFTSTDKENVMARLDKLNGYVFKEDVKPGTYKVDFINVVGENATDYDIESSEKVIVKDGSANEFKIHLSLKPTAEQVEPNTSLEPAEESIEKMLNGTESSRSQETITDHGVHNSINDTSSEMYSVKPVEKPQRQKFTIEAQTLKIIIGFTVIALLALMVFLYKKISYKHDYYDC